MVLDRCTVSAGEDDEPAESPLEKRKDDGIQLRNSGGCIAHYQNPQ